MEEAPLLAGCWIPKNEPDWTGLEALLPLELCGPFMWMGAVELEDGVLLGAYKHFDTRRYFHLDRSGATYGYRGIGYCRVRHHDAIEHVLSPDWLLQRATEEERAAVIRALEEGVKRDEADWEAGCSLPPVRI